MKKICSLIMFIFIFVGLYTTVIASTSYVEEVLFENSFDGLTLNTVYTTTPSYIINPIYKFTSLSTSATATVVSTPESTGQSIMFTTIGKTWGPYLEYWPTNGIAGENLIIEYKVSFADVENVNRILISIRGRDSTKATKPTLVALQNGTLNAADANGDLTAVMTPQINTWYTVSAHINSALQTFDLYINNELVRQNGKIKLDADNDLTKISTVLLYQQTPVVPAVSAVMYVDYFKCYTKVPVNINVAITSPIDGAKIPVDTDVVVNATATINSGTISRVEFYADDDLIGTSSTAPYSATWSNPPDGKHNLKAIAYSTDMAISQESNPVSFDITPISMPSMFADNMMIQRDAPIKLWGIGKDGDTITATFAGKQGSTIVSNGKWEMTLPAVGAISGNIPQTLVVASQSTNTNLTYNNILVGDLWLCSGQSNMELQLKNTNTGEADAQDANNYTNIRLFHQDGASASEPAGDVVNGQWQLCNYTNAKEFSAVGYYFGRKLYNDTNVPIGLIYSAVGGTCMYSWMGSDVLNSSPAFSIYASGAPISGIQKKYGLYYQMVKPLQKMGIKGVVWYQGESDTFDTTPFKDLFKALIAEWRADWGIGNFPFVFVQLPKYEQAEANRPWALARENQLLTLYETTNTAMAITIDTGSATNIHPGDKQPVGERLALGAKKLGYEFTGIYSGPILKDYAIENGAIIVEFDCFGSNLVLNGTDSFEICGQDGIYTSASAEVIGQNKVKIYNMNVAQPRSARYAYKNVPTVNLYNAVGIPASPFKTSMAMLRSNNIAPHISISSPANGDALIEGTANITVNADDADGLITKVEYYLGQIKLGESSVYPFSITLSGIENGNYALTAKATDNNEATFVSSPINIQMKGSIISRRVYFGTDFNTYTSSNFPQISGFNFTANTGNAKGVTSPDKEANDYCIDITTTNLTDTTVGTGPLIQIPMATPYPSGITYIDMDIRIINKNIGRSIQIRNGIDSSSNMQRPNIIIFNPDGFIHTTNSGFRDVSLVTYNENQWYHFSVKLDTVQKTLNIYMDGVNILADATIPYSETFTELKMLSMSVTGKAGENSSTYLDNISIYQYISSASVTNVSVTAQNDAVLQDLTSVPTDIKNIILTFDKDIDPSSLSNQTVLLQKCGKRYNVEYIGSYDVASKSYTLTLKQSLDFLTDFTVTVTTAVKTTDSIGGGYDIIKNLYSAPSDISIISGQFVSDANAPISNVGTNSIVGYNAFVRNNTSSSKKATIVLLQIGADGALKASSGTSNPSIPQNSNVDINARLTLKNYVSTDKICAYLWDDFINMNSYSYGAELK